MHDALEVTDELVRGWGGGVGGRVTGRGYAPACAGLDELSGWASTSGGQNKFSSVRVKIPCRGGVRRGEIMAPRPSRGAKMWCHHRPLSRKRTVVVGKSNQSLLLSLPPTHSTQIALKVKKILPVLDVLGLLHQEALALKKVIGILGLGRLNRHVVESGKK